MPSTSILSSSLSISGDLSFFETGSSVIQKVYNIVPNGTSSFSGYSDTTAELEYGINLITTAGTYDYCCKLPQPTTGKSVTVINKSGMDIQLFPSNIGGDINGNINGYITIPSNGTSYVFNCYENPNPGGWSVVQSGINFNIVGEQTELSLSHKTGSYYIGTFINNTLKITGSILGALPPISLLNPSLFYSSSYMEQYVCTSSYVSYLSPAMVGHHYSTEYKNYQNVTLITNLSGGLDYEYGGIGQSVLEFPYCAAVQCDIYFTNTLNNSSNGPQKSYFYDDPSTSFSGSAFQAFYDSTYQTWIDNRPYPIPKIFPGTHNTSYGSGQYFTATVVPGTFVSNSLSPFLAENAGDPGTITYYITNWGNSPWSNIGLNDVGYTSIGSFQHESNGHNYTMVYSRTVGNFNVRSNMTSSLPNLKIIPTFTATV